MGVTVCGLAVFKAEVEVALILAPRKVDPQQRVLVLKLNWGLIGALALQRSKNRHCLSEKRFDLAVCA